MEIRGRRQCQSCGTEWSYYDTGSVTCPDCGEIRSIGVDETRRLHTDGPAELDLEPIRATLASEPLARAADDLKERLRAYTRKRGFISAGELRDLDGQYLAARELLHAADIAARGQGPTEAEELYVLDLLSAADAGEWPPDSEIPDSLAAARGMAVADAVEAYRGDLRTWLDDAPDAEASKTLGSLRDRLKRAEALQGEIPLGMADELVAAAREIGQYLRNDDADTLSSARERLTRLD